MQIEASGRWVWTIRRYGKPGEYSLIPTNHTCMIPPELSLKDAKECVKIMYEIAADFNQDIVKYFEKEIERVGEAVYYYSHDAEGIKNNRKPLGFYLEKVAKNEERARRISGNGLCDTVNTQ